MKEKVAAQVTIKAPGKMTKKGRMQIARWLHSRANYLVKHGDLLVERGNFTARYFYG